MSPQPPPGRGRSLRKQSRPGRHRRERGSRGMSFLSPKNNH
nr:MAG TPA: hypothetical protein [Caudoviricetes sp.]